MVATTKAKGKSLIERLAELPASERDAFLASLSDKEAALLANDYDFLARPSQREPTDPYRFWLCSCGRGWGKTWVGANWIKRRADGGKEKAIGLVAPTYKGIRDVMIGGPTGILSLYAPHDPNRPQYNKTDLELTWPNGTTLKGLPASEPDRFRGFQFSCSWIDELAACADLEEVWRLFLPCLRLGNPTQTLITTTPKPSKVLKKIIANKRTITTYGSTFENASNLESDFLDSLVEEYGDTRLGQQELYGAVLDEIKGVLFSTEQIDACRVAETPSNLRRIVVAIDPAVSTSAESDETGIVVAGLGENSQYYVLADLSGRYSPNQWAKVAAKAFHTWKCDRIIAESNQGGELVRSNLQTIDPNLPVKLIHATRGKALRAEPISSLYEQGRVHHVGFNFLKLEEQMVLFDPANPPRKSPDRLDALVYSLAELSGRGTGLFVPVIHAYSERAYR